MQSPANYSVKLFARMRDLAGADSMVVCPMAGEGDMTVAQLRIRIAHQCPALASLLAISAVAVDHEFVPDAHRLSPRDEIAIVPPVSGG